MDLRHLRYFVTMAEAGSLMKASERLHVAQPALSVHLANLEKEVGVALVNRSNKGVELTSEGRLLYQRAIEQLRYHEETLSALKEHKDLPHGEVSLGIPSTSTSRIMPELYPHLRARAPGIVLNVVEASTAVLYEWLDCGRIDLAVLFSVPENAGLRVDPIHVDQFCLISAAGKGARILPAEMDFIRLFEFPMILSTSATTWRKVLDEIATQKGHRFCPVMTTDSWPTIRATVLSSDCAAIVPRSVVEADVRSGLFQAARIVNPVLDGTLSLISLSSQELSRAQREVRDVFVEIGRHMSPPGNITSMVHQILPGRYLPRQRASK